jgi:hypothetical protein
MKVGITKRVSALRVITGIVEAGPTPLEPEAISSIKRFNQLVKKHLMRFHYVSNPLALCIAVVHFLLFSCCKSSLPEWGLVFILMMVFLGLIV